MSRIHPSLQTTSEERVQADATPASRFARLRLRAVLLWISVLGPLGVFGLLSEDVAERESFRFDTPLLLWLHAHSTPFFDSFMLAFTWIGGVRLLAVSVAVMALLWWRKMRWEAGFLFAAMAGTCVLNLSMKAAFGRARPDLWLSLTPEHDYGFPSGHSMISCTYILALLAVIWARSGKVARKWTLTVIGLLFVAGVGLSRLYLGVHYPSDVLAGWSLSLAWVTLLQSIFARRWEKP